MLKLCLKIKARLNKNIRIIFNLSRDYCIGKFVISLPPDHSLPEYQLEHKKYDRFIVHISKYIEPFSVIVDVGANVGDTLAGVIQENKNLFYVCIEPDEIFYEYLLSNIKKIKLSYDELVVYPVKSLVGKDITNVSLEGRDGTKHAVINESKGISSQSLDEIISSLGLFSHNIRLIKVDVDGFDYDVINSAKGVLKKNTPILFFEMQFDFNYQRIGYVKTLKFLETIGYCDWTIFDNFGEIIIRTNNLETVMQLMTYIWSQNTGLTTRTFHYYDVLVVQKNDSDLIDAALSSYNK